MPINSAHIHARVTPSPRRSPLSFPFLSLSLKSCRQYAGRYKYIRSRARIRRDCRHVWSGVPRGSLSPRSFSLRESFSLWPSFSFTAVALVSCALLARGPTLRRKIPGRHFSQRNAESLRSRGVTIEMLEMFLPVPERIPPLENSRSSCEIDVSKAGSLIRNHWWLSCLFKAGTANSEIARALN